MINPLEKVKHGKGKALCALIGFSKAKIEGESAGSDTVNDWVASVLRNEAENEV